MAPLLCLALRNIKAARRGGPHSKNARRGGHACGTQRTRVANFGFQVEDIPSRDEICSSYHILTLNPSEFKTAFPGTKIVSVPIFYCVKIMARPRSRGAILTSCRLLRD
jgi:hypothetical protein